MMRTAAAGVEKTEKKIWTYQDYLKLNDDNRYEIINGGLMMTPSPNYGHQKIISKIFGILLKHIEDSGKGEVLSAPLDVVLDEREVFQPDIMVVLNENSGIIAHRGLMGAPDIAVEVVSPSSFDRDIRIKHEIYARGGIKEYWIVFPGYNVFQVWRLVDGIYELASEAEAEGSVHSPLLELDIPLGKIFNV